MRFQQLAEEGISRLRTHYTLCMEFKQINFLGHWFSTKYLLAVCVRILRFVSLTNTYFYSSYVFSSNKNVTSDYIIFYLHF